MTDTPFVLTPEGIRASREAELEALDKQIAALTATIADDKAAISAMAATLKELKLARTGTCRALGIPSRERKPKAQEASDD